MKLLLSKNESASKKISHKKKLLVSKLKAAYTSSLRPHTQDTHRDCVCHAQAVHVCQTHTDTHTDTQTQPQPRTRTRTDRHTHTSPVIIISKRFLTRLCRKLFHSYLKNKSSTVGKTPSSIILEYTCLKRDGEKQEKNEEQQVWHSWQDPPRHFDIYLHVDSMLH